VTDTTDRILTRDFVFVCAAGGGFFASFMLLLAVLPLYLRDLGGSDSQVGLVIGIFAFAALVPRPFVGREIDRGGGKRFMLAGAAIFVLASLLYLLASSIPILFAVRIVHGFGMALFTTAAFALVADLAPVTRRGEALGIWGTVPTMASAVAPFVGLEIRNRTGDSTVFIISAFLALIALLLVTFMRDPYKEHDPEAASQGLIERSVFFPAILVISMTWVFGAVSSFVLLFAEERGIVRGGLYFTASAGAVIVSRLLGGKLSDRHGRWAVIIPSMGLMSLGVGILSQSNSLLTLVLGAAVIGFAFGGGFPALSALAVDLAPAGRRGAAMGTFSASFEVGIGAGAMVMGVVAAMFGYSSMFLIGAALPVAGMLYALIRNRGLKAQPVGADTHSTGR
jgi:MFS family permease